MSDLFGSALPKQQHPAWRVTWCQYPSAENEPPALGCLSWKSGEVRGVMDCMECVHCAVRPAAVEQEARDA